MRHESQVLLAALPEWQDSAMLCSAARASVALRAAIDAGATADGCGGATEIRDSRPQPAHRPEAGSKVGDGGSPR